MSDLTRFRDHARKMSTAEHKPECPMLTAKAPYWPPGGWAPVDEDGNWTTDVGVPAGLGWLGPKPPWSPPHCDGCMSDEDRARFAALAAEVDDYLTPAEDRIAADVEQLSLEVEHG